jgi:hypothetical protein
MCDALGERRLDAVLVKRGDAGLQLLEPRDLLFRGLEACPDRARRILPRGRRELRLDLAPHMAAIVDYTPRGPCSVCGDE